ncbi:hypothetical protein NFI96_002210 [Prochilodus magdalenae]|nr:hypothetical protein NFI96_002210 [Prochilodus magdalenae]
MTHGGHHCSLDASNRSCWVSQTRKREGESKKQEKVNSLSELLEPVPIHYHPVVIDGHAVERVDSFKYLGVHISEDLSWSCHTTALVKKARQRLYHLRRLRYFKLPSKVLRNFFTCTIESILTGNITVWFSNSTMQDRQALQRVNGSGSSSVTSPALALVETTNESVCGVTVVSTEMKGLSKRPGVTPPPPLLHHLQELSDLRGESCHHRTGEKANEARRCQLETELPTGRCMEAYAHTGLPAVAQISVYREFSSELCHPPNLAQLTDSLTQEFLKFLGTTISRDLKWEKNTISIIKKAQQRMFFLRQLKKFTLPQTLMIQFYTAIIESILTASITIWFGSSTSQERTKLQRIIRTAERITGCNLPSLQQIYTSRVRKRAGKMTSDPSHPGPLLFQTLPSGRRLRSIKTSTTRHANSFIHRAVALLNHSGHLPLSGIRLAQAMPSHASHGRKATSQVPGQVTF